jgi:DNA recombination protein RmuC
MFARGASVGRGIVRPAWHARRMEQLGILLLGVVLGLGLGMLAMGLIGARRKGVDSVAAVQAEARAELLSEQLAAVQAERDQAQSMEGLLKPLQEHLQLIGQQADRAQNDRVKAEAQIVQQLQTVREQYASLGEATRQIAASMTKGQTRGQWGEMQLEQLLAHAGLLEGTHYTRQASRTIDGAGIRPDIVVHLPGEGEVHVDAKFPFDAFWAAGGTQDPQERDGLLAKHAKDVYARATELASKGYGRGHQSPDFVVMFLPLESLLSGALEADPTLLERTFERRVILATPTTMLALLRTIGFGYDRALMAANAEEIRAEGAEMLKRLGSLVEHLEAMRKGLASAVGGFNAFVGSFERQALTQARRLNSMGVQAAKPLETSGDITEQLREIRGTEAEAS